MDGAIRLVHRAYLPYLSPLERIHPMDFVNSACARAVVAKNQLKNKLAFFGTVRFPKTAGAFSF